jgi:uncharacterized membrane protein YphA (DoxX/SURF4 family)
VAGLGQSVVRFGVGAYWLFFASQKWPAPYGFPPHGIGWMLPYITESARTNPIPGLRVLLTQLAVPNAHLLALGQVTAETVVGALLIVGLATRAAALVGTLLAIELSLTVAFLDADLGARWLYYLPIVASLSVLVGGAGTLALDRLPLLPRWLRS